MKDKLPFEDDPGFIDAVEEVAPALAAHLGTPAEQATVEAIRRGVRKGFAADPRLDPAVAPLWEERLLARARVRAAEIVAERVAAGLGVYQRPKGSA